MPADLLTDLRALLARVPEGYTEGPYHAWLNSVWLVSGAGVDCPVADCDPLHSPANAHLFALAPDLAAALDRAVEALEGFEERAETAETRLENLVEALRAEALQHNEARRALARAVEALEGAERKINRQKDTISRYDDVINAMCHHEARVVVSNALVDAHNGMGRDAIEDNHGRLVVARLLTEARRALTESRGEVERLRGVLGDIDSRTEAVVCPACMDIRAMAETALSPDSGRDGGAR